jgi:hypothetical protein
MRRVKWLLFLMPVDKTRNASVLQEKLMRKSLKIHVVGLIALGLITVSSYGALYNYSYVFADGNTVAGTVSGTPNGPYLDNVANMTVSFNGTPMSGTVYTAKFNYGVYNWVYGPGTFGFGAGQNNFMFINSDFLNNDNSYTEVFSMRQGGVYARCDSQNLVKDVADGTWSLTPVPEPSTWIAGLGTLGMLGVFGWRKRT